MGSAGGFLHSKLVLSSSSFWVSVSSFLLALFKFFIKVFFFRYIKDDNSQLNSSSHFNIVPKQSSGQTDSEPEEAQPKELYSEIFSGKDSEYDGFESSKQSPKSDFAFKFRFPTYEEFSRSQKGNGGIGSVDATASPTSNTELENELSESSDNLSRSNEEPEITSSISKYEVLSGQSLSCFVEEAKVASFSVSELYDSHPHGDPPGDIEVSHCGFLSGNDLVEESLELEAVDEAVPSDSAEDREAEKQTFMESPYSEKEKSESREKCELSGKKDVFDGDDFLTERNFVESDDSDSESISSSREFSVISPFIGSTIDDGFLSDTDFEGINNEIRTAFRNFDGTEREDFDDSEDEDEDPEKFSAKFFDDNNNNNDNSRAESFNGRDENTGDDDGLDGCGKPNEENLNSSSAGGDLEDTNGFDTLWEHQELIEQLKMELKKVRATGLPTILEDSECPKMMEDLKPWKIDEKFQHGDRLSELHKFYKSYRERMRKFDILNYQKMYTIGVLQSKDPFHSLSSCKPSSPPPMISLLPRNLWRIKRKRSDSDPMMKFIRELHVDLELVYVGQLCLSWEILQWQYEKAFELWESDPYGMRQYNEVAGEFQQFQVLMQRFIENESFQGPRVENYVKNRCAMRNLLQVPVIREDNSKNKRRGRKIGSESGAIKGDMLLEILEESIRTIWRFIRADKQAHTSTILVKCRRGVTEAELQDPADMKLLMEIQTDLQKKEKRLKELLRSGKCCILKRLKKHDEEEEGTDHLYFFSQVDMKLVARVLNMSRITTDHLVWCHNKLSKINFVNRKIRIEPSFLLFPC